MSLGSLSLHRVIRATPERLYSAFLDPDALVKWMPPHGFTGKVHHLEARAGGCFRMSFTNLTSGKAESFAGTYLELTPNQRIRHTDGFDDPGLPGEMLTTITFSPVFCGTEVVIQQEGIPEVIPVAACYLGWQESLALLTLLVEAVIPE